MIVKHAELEKDKTYYETKFMNASSELATLKGIRDKNEKLEEAISKLTKTIESLEKNELANNLELNRLRSCESEMNASHEKNKLKEQKILELLHQNSELDTMRINANEQMKKFRAEYDEIIDQLSGENALFQNEKSALQAQLMNLKEENSAEVKKICDEVRY